jgi:diketogulonate reductase-like aldo/keto reductase
MLHRPHCRLVVGFVAVTTLMMTTTTHVQALHQPSFPLNNGQSIPALGLGTWKSDPGVVKDAVVEAIRCGYRHIDCAHIYGNEIEIGSAIAECIRAGVCQRGELFVTSKLWNDSHDSVKAALETTLRNLQLDYLDMYLSECVCLLVCMLAYV